MSDFKPARRKALTIKKVQVWSKGQFTIPADIRENLGIREDTILEVFQAGKAIVVTPERMLVNELASFVHEATAKYGLDLKMLLHELREGNHQYETD